MPSREDGFAAFGREAIQNCMEASMRVHDLLQIAGLPTLVFVGLGAGMAAASFGGAEPAIPVEVSSSPHCRVANIPTQVQSPEAMMAYEEAEPPLWTDLGTLTY